MEVHCRAKACGNLPQVFSKAQASVNMATMVVDLYTFQRLAYNSVALLMSGGVNANAAREHIHDVASVVNEGYSYDKNFLTLDFPPLSRISCCWEDLARRVLAKR